MKYTRESRQAEAVKAFKNGGILEHPKGSKLWKEAPLPMPGEPQDEYGGFTILIDQYHFGHVARKWTHLYIVGIDPNEVPPIPLSVWVALSRKNDTDAAICGV